MHVYYVFEFFKRCHDDSRPGCPSRTRTSRTDNNIEKFGNLFWSDPWLTIHAITKIAGINKECIRQFQHEKSVYV